MSTYNNPDYRTKFKQLLKEKNIKLNDIKSMDNNSLVEFIKGCIKANYTDSDNHTLIRNTLNHYFENNCKKIAVNKYYKEFNDFNYFIKYLVNDPQLKIELWGMSLQNLLEKIFNSKLDSLMQSELQWDQITTFNPNIQYNLIDISKFCFNFELFYFGFLGNDPILSNHLKIFKLVLVKELLKFPFQKSIINEKVISNIITAIIIFDIKDIDITNLVYKLIDENNLTQSNEVINLFQAMVPDYNLLESTFDTNKFYETIGYIHTDINDFSKEINQLLQINNNYKFPHIHHLLFCLSRNVTKNKYIESQNKIIGCIKDIQFKIKNYEMDYTYFEFLWAYYRIAHYIKIIKPYENQSKYKNVMKRLYFQYESIVMWKCQGLNNIYYNFDRMKNNMYTSEFDISNSTIVKHNVTREGNVQLKDHIIEYKYLLDFKLQNLDTNKEYWCVVASNSFEERFYQEVIDLFEEEIQIITLIDT